MNLKIIDPSIVDKNREYVSFSEIYLFNQCPWKHHQAYNLGNREPNNFWAAYGTAIHEAIEQKWKFKNNLAWIKMCKIILLMSKFSADEDGVCHGETPQQWAHSALRIYKDFFSWVAEEFSTCELYDIEYELDEELRIEGFDRRFKGYIDLILRDKESGDYHLIDLKTSGWGWGKKQLSDTKKLYQIILYKFFFCQKNKIDPKKIKTHYLLLLRAPPKKMKYAITLHSVTSGEKKMNNSFQWLLESVKKIQKGIRFKTPTTCSFCTCKPKKKVSKRTRS